MSSVLDARAAVAAASANAAAQILSQALGKISSSEIPDLAAKISAAIYLELMPKVENGYV